MQSSRLLIELSNEWGNLDEKISDMVGESLIYFIFDCLF